MITKTRSQWIVIWASSILLGCIDFAIHPRLSDSALMDLITSVIAGLVIPLVYLLLYSISWVLFRVPFRTWDKRGSVLLMWLMVALTALNALAVVHLIQT